MNETLLLVLAWLPAVAESGLFIFVAKFFKKQLDKHFSLPNQIVNEIKELRASNAALNSQVAVVIEENRKLQRINEKLSSQLKGFKDYEEVSKN